MDTAPEIQQSPPTGGSSLSKEEPNTSKFVTVSNPEYIVFTDSELEQVRRSYFEQKRLGTEQNVTMSNELFCRLIRNTMTNMISIARATEDFRYPNQHEVNAMARRLVEYYPMIKDKSPNNPWVSRVHLVSFACCWYCVNTNLYIYSYIHVAKKLRKRLSNVRSPRKAKVPPSKKPRQEVSSDVSTTDYDGDSGASTIILEQSPVRPRGSPENLTPRTSTPVETQESSDEECMYCIKCNLSLVHPNIPVMPSAGSADIMDSQKIQARHYKTLQEQYKSKKPNKAAVTHLLNLEFQSRRAFITSDVLKEQDRAASILEAYPCFRELDHVLDELQQVIQPTNSHYISEMQSRWRTFYSKVQFYAIMKKAMKPPKTLNGVEHVTAVFRALPLLFPSSTMPPKKLGSSSEALFHVLATSEDPNGFIQQRPLSSPVLLVSEDNCMIAIGKTPVTTFSMERLNEGLLYLMAYYYALHMTYPKCISTVLSVLQTEVLHDSIHDQDLTPQYKKSIGEWKSFSE
ncbi:hypothetical protein ACEWY4_003848 [Coilia grayii]|uniref:Uncharacterized protein n=1 Tax=Coilia grayii TaxID=363190 RepID=A0ABD1KSF8_9TELE